MSGNFIHDITLKELVSEFKTSKASIMTVHDNFLSYFFAGIEDCEAWMNKLNYCWCIFDEGILIGKCDSNLRPGFNRLLHVEFEAITNSRID